MTTWGYLAMGALSVGQPAHLTGEALKEFTWTLLIFGCLWAASYWVLREFDRNAKRHHGAAR